MEEKLFFAVIGAVITYIVWRIQQYSNRLLAYKEKMRIVERLLIESISESQRQKNAFIILRDQIDNNYGFFPQLLIASLPSLSQLRDRLNSDEYYVAFTRLFKNIIDVEKLYFELKADVIFLDLQISELIKNHSEEMIKYMERRAQCFEMIYAVRKEALQIHSEHDDVHIKNQSASIFNIFAMHADLLKNMGDQTDLKVIHELVIDPAIKVINKETDWVLLKFMVSLSHLSGLKGLIDIRNIDFAVLIRNRMPEIKAALSRLAVIQLRLSGNEIKPLYL